MITAIIAMITITMMIPIITMIMLITIREAWGYHPLIEKFPKSGGCGVKNAVFGVKNTVFFKISAPKFEALLVPSAPITWS